MEPVSHFHTSHSFSPWSGRRRSTRYPVTEPASAAGASQASVTPSSRISKVRLVGFRFSGVAGGSTGTQDDPVRALAPRLAPDGLHPVGVGLSSLGRSGIGVGRHGGRGVGDQRGHITLAHGAQDLVAGDAVGVLRRGAPAQVDPAAVNRLGGEVRRGQVNAEVMGQLDPGPAGHLATVLRPGRPSP